MKIEEIDFKAAQVAKKPRVTLEHIKSLVTEEHFRIVGSLTICILTLKNGFHVTGEAATADPDNFNIKLAQELSRSRALEKIWPLEGYLLCQRNYEAAQ